MSTSPATVRAPAGTQWTWPIDVNRYDRSPELTSAEQLAIRAILKGRMQGRYRRDPWRSSLRRLLDPILDSLHVADASHTDTGLIVKLLLRHMQRSRCSFWKWTESEWGHLACNTIAGFERTNAVSARLVLICLRFPFCSAAFVISVTSATSIVSGSRRRCSVSP